MNTLALFAGTTFKFFLDEKGSGLPGSKVSRECRAEIDDDGCGSGSRDMHRSAVRADKKGGGEDELSQFPQVEFSDQREDLLRVFPQDKSSFIPVLFSADKNHFDIRMQGESLEEFCDFFRTPAAKFIPRADVEDHHLETDESVFCDKFPDLLGFFLFCGRKGETRDVADRNPDRFHDVEMIFHAVVMTVFSVTGDGLIIDKIPELDFVSDLDLGSGKQSHPGGSRPTVEIENSIKALFSDAADKPEEAPHLLSSRQDNNPVQAGMPFEEFFVGLFYDIGEESIRKILSQNREGGSGHDDVADSSQPNQKDLLDRGWINPWFSFPDQWWPHR